jgi:prolipoprotein diacylglyceryltransferase
LAYLNNRYREIWRPGTLFGLFLLWWGSGRAILELFRPDQPTIGTSSITYSMLMSIGLALTGIVIILSRNDKMPDLFGRRRRRVSKPKPRRQN